MVKNKILNYLNKIFKEKSKEITKNYIMKCKTNITIDVMEIRLNMLEDKSNYKGLYRGSIECLIASRKKIRWNMRSNVKD